MRKEFDLVNPDGFSVITLKYKKIHLFCFLGIFIMATCLSGCGHRPADDPQSYSSIWVLSIFEVADRAIVFDPVWHHSALEKHRSIDDVNKTGSNMHFIFKSMPCTIGSTKQWVKVTISIDNFMRGDAAVVDLVVYDKDVATIALSGWGNFRLSNDAVDALYGESAVEPSDVFWRRNLVYFSFFFESSIGVDANGLLVVDEESDRRMSGVLSRHEVPVAER